MYIATIFNAEYGDIGTVAPAACFIDGVAFVFAAIGHNPAFTVVTSRHGRSFSIEVKNGDVTLATVVDQEPVDAACQHPLVKQIIVACHALVAGDQSAIQALFTKPVREDDLKSRVLQHCYAPGSYTQLNGYAYLAARHNTTQVGIFILDGIFTRDVFKAAVAEAKDAGLKSSRMYVYASLCTYSGPAIQFVKLDDLGLLEQEGEPAKALEGEVLPPESALHRQARELLEELQAKEDATRVASEVRM